MLKRLLLIAMAAALAVSMSFANQSDGKVVIPVNKTAAASRCMSVIARLVMEWTAGAMAQPLRH